MIDIEDVKRLTLQPGDTLVLRVPSDVCPDEIEWLNGQMIDAFPGHRTIVLTEGTDLEVVSAPPA